MRAHRESPEAAAKSPPDLEIRKACFACGGDLSARLQPHGAQVICRRCGFLGPAVVERDGYGVLVSQLLVGAA